MITGKRIPIKSAKAIGHNYGYDQVIIVAWDGVTKITSVCTWGKSLSDCDQAADGGNFVKKSLGWPPKKCNDKPSRVKNLQSQLERECTWIQDDDESYDTECGNKYEFVNDGIKENGFTHCPYCGGKLKTK